MTALRRGLLVALWLGSLAGALLAGAYGYKYRARIRAYVRSVQGSPSVQTNLYNLRVRKLAVENEGRDGAIAALGSGLLFVNRRGLMWYVDSALALHPLTLRAPINMDEFTADPANAETEFVERFAVKDLLIQETPAGIRLLASHGWWNAAADCNTLRVSVLETTTDQLLDAGSDSAVAWRTVFESAPCRELIESGPGRPRHVTLGFGGRLAARSAREVVLTVGEFSAEYEAPAAQPEGVVDSYGKTFVIDVPAGTFRPFTSGHRNPQGLAAAPDGRLWLTEHGARGGDELNLLIEGRDYGSPHVTYGTQYGQLIWPGNPVQGGHEGYEKPMYAWVPSIGVSQLVVVGATAFPSWTGDLLVSALASRFLYRVRIEDGRTILSEPINVDLRMRDIEETADGSIVLLADDGFLVYLDNLDAAGVAAGLTPAARGEALAGQCRSCHAIAADSTGRIGPNLWGVVGRRIASSPGYRYSSALRQHAAESWTDEQLRRFLADPQAFAPGTAMPLTTRYTDQQLSDLVAYLGTQR